MLLLILTHHSIVLHALHQYTLFYITSTDTMGGASKVLLVCLRIWQLVCSVIVLGILGSFLHRVHEAGAWKDGRIVYGVVTASISTFFSIVFIAPFLYAFLACPFDFVMFVMWLVLFCLEMTVCLSLVHN